MGVSCPLLPSPLAPFFVADAADAKLIDALAHEQYTRVESCHERKSCGQDQYTQALITLFQSRERALAAFQQVRAWAPNSRFANASTSWIELLQASGSGLSVLDVHSDGMPKVTETFVWETLERELAEANEPVRHLFSDRARQAGRVTAGSSVSQPTRPMPLSKDKDQGTIAKDKSPATGPKEQDQGPVHDLHKQLKERERLIAEQEHRIIVMANQLDALKRIDIDTRERSRPLRASVLTAPSAEGAKK